MGKYLRITWRRLAEKSTSSTEVLVHIRFRFQRFQCRIALRACQTAAQRRARNSSSRLFFKRTRAISNLSEKRRTRRNTRDKTKLLRSDVILRDTRARAQCITLHCVALRCNAEYRQEVTLKRAKRLITSVELSPFSRQVRSLFTHSSYAHTGALTRHRPASNGALICRFTIWDYARHVIVSGWEFTCEFIYKRAPTVMPFFRKAWTSRCIIPDRRHICPRHRKTREAFKPIKINGVRLAIVPEMEFLCEK